MPSRRVAEWQQRKATHAPDPLLDPASSSGRSLSAGGGGERYTARVGRKIVARTVRAQHANRRVYFPIADVREGVLLPSPKRWR